MACWKPPLMYECVSRSTGEVFFRFRPPVGSIIRREFPVACGQCSGCRSKNARNWAIRCYHESIMHEQSSFITLTVDEENMEKVFPGRSLRYGPFQLFLKRFRKRVVSHIRFFMCGEYGSKFERPHYHAIFFGWFPNSEERDLFRTSAVGDLYTSKVLSDLWPFGFHSVGHFDFACAQYVAGYIHKKINGKLQDVWYKGKAQEFARMSLKPGIGEPFYRKFTSDMYRRDKVVLPGGKEFSIPRYYDKLHELYHPSHLNKLKILRQEPDVKRDARNTPERLAARKVIHEQRLKSKRRSFEK